MTFDDMDETARQFLKRLFEQTEGQSSRQVSMYDVGAALGWDRDAAAQAAQDIPVISRSTLFSPAWPSISAP